MDDLKRNLAENKSAAWSSLEICKLIVAVLTPVVLLYISIQFSNQQNQRAQQSARFERVAEQRTQLWQQLGPNLNDIYAYLMYVGGWNKMEVKDVVAAKRNADKVFYANRPFFSERFVRDYESFMNASFQMFNGMGEDAKPQTTAIHRRNTAPSIVSGKENSEAVHSSYYRLLETVAEEFGLTVIPPARPRTPTEADVPS